MLLYQGFVDFKQDKSPTTTGQIPHDNRTNPPRQQDKSPTTTGQK